MPKRILLVDDEEIFLNSLKQYLDMFSDTFITDISYSINDAIKHIALQRYDIIVTDIRMPRKSGIDLLIYLKDIHFPGKIIVMSAFSTEENVEAIKSLGAVDVISKPFNVEWFKNLLLGHFEEEDKKTVVFESIDLVTVLQVINFDRKTTTLQVETTDKKGILYFENGEIIHAEFDSLVGEEALFKIIGLKDSIISVVKGTKKVPTTVSSPFIELIMNISSIIDEMGHMKVKEKVPVPNKKSEFKQTFTIEVQKVLKLFPRVEGFLGASVVTSEEFFYEKKNSTGHLNLEYISSLIFTPIKEARNMVKKINLGRLDIVHYYTDKAIILVANHINGKMDFHIFVVLQLEGNVAMAVIQLKRAAMTLKNIISKFNL